MTNTDLTSPNVAEYQRLNVEERGIYDELAFFGLDHDTCMIVTEEVVAHLPVICDECAHRNHGDCDEPRGVSQTTETGAWCWVDACCCGALY